MGKRIIARARGKGGPPYKSPSHRFIAKPSYAFSGNAKVLDIVHDPARTTPLAKIVTEEGKELYILATEGLKVGQTIVKGTAIENGNILRLKDVPKGSHVYAIEMTPGGGPKLCCACGTKAIVVNQEEKKTIIKLPSKRFKNMHPNCFATLGIPAGSGAKDKPLLKAGNAYYKYRARNKLYPRTSASRMNAVDHPFGGSGKPGIPKSRPRNAPPGAKVGAIASKRTGKKKR